MIIDSNIFGFADNFGLRSTIRQPNVTLRRNVFFANLFNHLTDANFLWADGANWQRRVECDSALMLEANSLEAPRFTTLDPAFTDRILPRLFALPSRISSVEWTSITTAIGSAMKPNKPPAPSSLSKSQPVAASAAPCAPSALDSLLSKFNHAETKTEPPPPAKTYYCPVYDYRNADALVIDESDVGPGAHRRKLTVLITEDPLEVKYNYVRISAADLEPRERLNQQAIELDITDCREGSSNASLFPTGTTNAEYSACNVTALQGDSRTRVAIILKDGTQASKTVKSSGAVSRFRVRGVAYVTNSINGLAIVVHSIGPI